MNLLQFFENPGRVFSSPIVLLIFAFQIWMLIDAVRREEWIWAVCIFLFPPFSPLLYFFLVYRASQPAGAPTFEIPGASVRQRIKELQDQIHHLDKAHHHSQLADVYFAQGKLPLAEKEYLLALERDGEDLETRAHYGQCLLRLNRPKEARDVLEKVVRENPQHEYGHTMMMYAETLMALGENDAAMAAWKKVLEHNTYSQARVQYAQLLLGKGDSDGARRELEGVIADAGHVPVFQRKREKVWVNNAKALLKKIR